MNPSFSVTYEFQNICGGTFPDKLHSCWSGEASRGDICIWMSRTVDEHIHLDGCEQTARDPDQTDSQTAWLPRLPTWKLQSCGCFLAQQVEAVRWLCSPLCTSRLNLATSAPNQAAAPPRQAASQGAMAGSPSGETSRSKTRRTRLPVLYKCPPAAEPGAGFDLWPLWLNVVMV